MRIAKYRLLFAGIVVASMDFAFHQSHAQPLPTEPQSADNEAITTEDDGAEEGAEIEAPTPARRSRGNTLKQKRNGQLEGTKARERFEAVTVIKSRYQRNGKHLDVDPD